MEFIFETHVNEQLHIIKRDDLDKLRKMMVSFELMVNTTLPSIRVHLKEK